MGNGLKKVLITSGCTIICSVITAYFTYQKTSESMVKEISSEIANTVNVNVDVGTQDYQDIVKSIVEENQGLQNEKEALLSQNENLQESVSNLENNYEKAVSDQKELESSKIDVGYVSAGLVVDGTEVIINKKNSVAYVDGMLYYSADIMNALVSKKIQVDDDVVLVGNETKKLDNLLAVGPPYQTKRYHEDDDIAISGQKYRGFYMYDKDGFALFNLQGKYSSLICEIGHQDASDMADADLYVYLDGELTNTYQIMANELIQTYEIPLNYAHQMRLELKTTYGAHYGFVNCKLRE